MIALEKKMLIVGDGLAGLACAIRLREDGDERRILVYGYKFKPVMQSA